MIRMYEGGASSIVLGKRFDLPPGCVCGLLKRRGVRRRSAAESATRYQCDHHYFDVVDTEQKAYWLGFLYADGCVREAPRGSQSSMLQLCLAEVDIAHIERFRSHIGATHPITTQASSPRHRSARIVVTSRGLCDGLARYGVTPRKSLTCVPPVLPAELARHFWRGVFDGDGCMSQRRKRGSPATAALIGNMNTCQAYAAWIGSTLGKMVVPKPSRKMWTVTVCGYQVNRLGAEFYDDASVWLDRKRRSFDDWKRVWSERQSRHVYLTHEGRTMTAAAWARERGITRNAIHGALRRGKTPAQILSRTTRELCHP